MSPFKSLLTALSPKLYAFFYEGADTTSSERTQFIPYVMDSEDTQDEGTRTSLRASGRKVSANQGLPRAILKDIARNTIGAGIQLYSRVDSPEDRAAHNAYWSAWQESCEVSGRFAFPSLCRMLSYAMDDDGDVGVMLTDDTSNIRSGYALPRLQVIHSHRIVSDTRRNGRSQRVLQSDDAGVVRDAFGRLTGFRIVDKDNDTRIIPASSFFLLFDPDRSDQSRGVPLLTHGLNHARDKSDIIRFEKMGVKAMSAMAFALKTTSLAKNPAKFFGPQTKESTDTVTREQMFGGSIPRLRPGEDIVQLGGNRPSSAFSGFLNYLDREIAIGSGIPLEFVHDPTPAGGAVQRFILEKSQRRFEERQELFTRFAKWVRLRVLAYGIVRGEIRAAPNWWEAVPQMPRKITVDVGRESQANRDDITAGLRTEQEDWAERGANWQDGRRQIEEAALDLLERAKRITKAHPDIPLQTAIDLLQRRGQMPSQIEAPKQDAAEPVRK